MPDLPCYFFEKGKHICVRLKIHFHISSFSYMFVEFSFWVVFGQKEHGLIIKMRVISGELHSSSDNQLQVQTGTRTKENQYPTKLDENTDKGAMLCGWRKKLWPEFTCVLYYSKGKLTGQAQTRDREWSSTAKQMDCSKIGKWLYNEVKYVNCTNTTSCTWNVLYYKECPEIISNHLYFSYI
jgi:hypothetical protein